MDTTRTDQATSSKRGAHDARDAKTEVGHARGEARHPSEDESGKDRSPAGARDTAGRQTEPLDVPEEDPYDNIACTD
jgi:hypothetical protein